MRPLPAATQYRIARPLRTRSGPHSATPALAAMPASSPSIPRRSARLRTLSRGRRRARVPVGAWRVIRAEDAAFPAFYRVVWRAHVAEWSDLSLAEQAALMGAVGAVERVLRDALAPTKINLASLGNVVPHLHWHVIARFDWDSHFPAPVWAAPAREVAPAPVTRLRVGPARARRARGARRGGAGAGRLKNDRIARRESCVIREVIDLRARMPYRDDGCAASGAGGPRIAAHGRPAADRGAERKRRRRGPAARGHARRPARIWRRALRREREHVDAGPHRGRRGHRQLEATGRGWVVEEDGRDRRLRDRRRAAAPTCGRCSSTREAEGRGHGSRLHDTMVEWLWTHGLGTLWLSTGADTKARGFYERRGWRCRAGTAGRRCGSS